MTITTTQFQTVQLAVNTILAGEELENVFMATQEDFENLVYSFGVYKNQTTQHFVKDVDYALDTLEKVAQNIVDSYDMNVFSELSDYYDFDEVCDIIEKEELIFHQDVFEMSELSEYYLDECGLPNNAESYLDYNALERDLSYGGDIADYFYHMALEDALEDGKDENEARSIANDYEPTQEEINDYVEMVMESISHDTEYVKRYFDHEKFGRDMELDGNYYTCNSGIIEVTA